MSGKYLLATFGCKVSQYESQELREVLESAGFKPAGPNEVPDLAVINTCAVTAEALRKGRQAVRRFARQGRTSVVVVGCGATAEADRFRRISNVSAVWGHEVSVPSELRQFVQDRWNPTMLDPPVRTLTHNEVSVDPNHDRRTPSPNPVNGTRAALPHDLATNDSVRTLPIVNSPDVLLGRIDRFAGHQRAFLKVQDGCDAFCTYCIIPRLRPMVRSKPMELVAAEAQQLVSSGHQEITLTGIFLGAYGRETALRRRFATKVSPLAELVDRVSRVEGLERLRLSSLEPGDVDDSLLDVLANRPACVPHLHLPLQSGSAQILRRMNRQYTVDSYLDMITEVRRRLDRPAITTDVIVGFPGETDADWEASVTVARASRFLKIHAFPFSPRDGTAAARWRQDFIDHQRVRNRLAHLAEVERECSMEYRRSLLGMRERVIIETGSESWSPNGDPTPLHGRADRYVDIHFAAPPGTNLGPGQSAPVRIDRITPTRTHGTCLSPGAAAIPLCIL
jgi:threonylcarbamoyladenosine tRNA methylthiotransferase MtaB